MKCRLSAYSWSSAASCSKIANGAAGFCGKPIVLRKLLQRRQVERKSLKTSFVL